MNFYQNFVRLSILFLAFFVLCSEGQANGGTIETDESEASSRTPVALYTEFLGSALCFTSLHVEVIPVRFDRGSLFKSFCVSAGIGIGPIQNTYAPLLGKLVLFQGTGHLELGLGVSILVAAGSPPDTQMLLPVMSNSDVNVSA